jgi:hypothetical protein
LSECEQHDGDVLGRPGLSQGNVGRFPGPGLEIAQELVSSDRYGRVRSMALANAKLAAATIFMAAVIFFVFWRFLILPSVP